MCLTSARQQCLPSTFVLFEFFFFKKKTAYERKECDWSSDVCSSDLCPDRGACGDVLSHRVPEGWRLQLPAAVDAAVAGDAHRHGVGHDGVGAVAGRLYRQGIRELFARLGVELDGRDAGAADRRAQPFAPDDREVGEARL